MDIQNYHDECLRYSAVIGHCYKLSEAGNLNASVGYGRRSGLLNEDNALLPLGVLVGDVILRAYSI
jgi:hypothetical protein